MENIEIKARLKDLEQVRSRVLVESDEYIGLDHQSDTYFKTKSGRLKLRESTLSGSYLILYNREDTHAPVSSNYHMLVVEDPKGVKEMMGQLLGLHKVIRKKREIFLYQNVRIHLDQVEHLGDYLEMEAVLDEKYHDEAEEKEKIFHLMKILEIEAEDLVSESYENLA
jgi:predicted adenylyl cyclase CyaB